MNDQNRNGHTVALPLSSTPDAALLETLSRRVKLTHGNIAVSIDPKTPIAEYLSILHYFVRLGEHVGFLIGDVIRFGRETYGKKYTEAIAATGLALDTLKAYVSVATHVPPEFRKASLSFSVHREVAKLKDQPEQMAIILQRADECAKAGAALSVSKVRDEVTELMPKRTRAKKRTTAKPVSSYTPTEEERAGLDAAMAQFELAVAALDGGSLEALILKLDRSERRDWQKLLHPMARFAERLETAECQPSRRRRLVQKAALKSTVGRV